MKPEETLAILKSEFPNLKWKGGKGNRENVHGFCATFACGWRFHVEVLPVGCLVWLTCGHETISSSPNEQGKTLADAIAVIKSDWTEIASAMNYTLSKNKKMENQTEIPSYLTLLINGGFLTPNSWGDEDDSTLGWSIDPTIVGFIGRALVQDIYFSVDIEASLCSFSVYFQDGTCTGGSQWIAFPATLREFKEHLISLTEIEEQRRPATGD